MPLRRAGVLCRGILHAAGVDGGPARGGGMFSLSCTSGTSAPLVLLRVVTSGVLGIATMLALLYLSLRSCPIFAVHSQFCFSRKPVPVSQLVLSPLLCHGPNPLTLLPCTVLRDRYTPLIFKFPNLKLTFSNKKLNKNSWLEIPGIPQKSSSHTATVSGLSVPGLRHPPARLQGPFREQRVKLTGRIH